jgi:hypothetical protein
LFDSESEKQNLASIARDGLGETFSAQRLTRVLPVKEGFSGLAGATDRRSHQDSTF